MITYYLLVESCKLFDPGERAVYGTYIMKDVSTNAYVWSVPWNILSIRKHALNHGNISNML